MFNNKDSHLLFQNKKEQKYLKKLIQKFNNSELNNLYKEFEKISSIKEAEKFVKKYKKFINAKIEITYNLNETKEKIAYELIETILTKYQY